MEKELYILSGLGADERVFQKLDFSEYAPKFIKWIDPIKNESMENYATRLLDQITTSKPVLIGLSFGGLIAIEIAKQIDTEKVIVIASAKTKYEIPFYYRLAGKIGLHKLLPTRFLKKSNFLTNRFFGVSSINDKVLLKQILFDTNTTFLKWAIDKVSVWKNVSKTKNCFHIHGTHDRILPFKYVKCDAQILNGGHLMTVNKSEELSKIVRKFLETVED